MLNILVSFIFPFLFGTTAETPNKTESLKSWYGTYEFEETPVKALADYYMVMEWKMTIGYGKGMEQATIFINGQQTEIVLSGLINGDIEKISIELNEPPFGTDEVQLGDLLLTLTKTKTGITTT